MSETVLDAGRKNKQGMIFAPKEIIVTVQVMEGVHLFPFSSYSISILI